MSLLLEGGPWLGQAREFIKREFHNGDRVTWGSTNILLPNASVEQLERLAAVAATAMKETMLKEQEQLRKLVSDMLAVVGNKEPTYAWRAQQLGVSPTTYHAPGLARPTLPNQHTLVATEYGLMWVEVPEGCRWLNEDEIVADGDSWYEAETHDFGYFSAATPGQIGVQAGKVWGTRFVRPVDKE